MMICIQYFCTLDLTISNWHYQSCLISISFQNNKQIAKLIIQIIYYNYIILKSVLCSEDTFLSVIFLKNEY